jgi:hypothetical protein
MFSFVVCFGSWAALWKCFKIVDNLSKSEFKQQVVAAITSSSSIFTIGTKLPGFCLTAFDAIFTDHLWSMRGFGRSCIVSIITVTFLLIIWYSSIPGEWHVTLVALSSKDIPHASQWNVMATYGGLNVGPHGELSVTPTLPPGSSKEMMFSRERLDILVFLPLLYNLGADFAALIATRRILKYLSELHLINIQRLTVMFLLSAFVLLLISAVFMDFAATITYSILGVGPISGETIRAPPIYLQAIMFPVYKLYPALFGGWSMTTIYGVFVWSTLIGLFWIVIFGISLIMANIGMKLESVGPWLDRNCHVKQRPFQVLAVLVGTPFLVACVIYHLLT